MNTEEQETIAMQKKESSLNVHPTMYDFEDVITKTSLVHPFPGSPKLYCTREVHLLQRHIDLET